MENLDISHLQEADVATLRRLWETSRGVEPPKTFTACLMCLELAWDAQAARAGRESTTARRGWSRIIKKRGEGGSINLAGNALHPTIGAGTRLLKEWGGTTHEILVVENGATLNGQSYSSLSAVARAMTSTNRNGPKFFGL